MVVLLLLSMLSSPFAEATQAAYAQRDADRLRTLLGQASSRADSLLVRYRLYPLTEDASVLDDLPSSLSDGTAREHALLSGLWAYRAGEASIFSAVRYGRRSTSLLEQAKAQAPRAPFVLLVEGQSLLFRPAIAGKDPAAAVSRFSRLAKIVETSEAEAITETEAHMWRWLALREADRPDEAQALFERLLRQNPGPLYRQFLESPPDV
ncbi:hypothetical protein [Salinibacter altiplanensis]|uniref:hypothetical protein n=1 Tax=Salinibacter altiplanensis TaxID=1803181 RepID=UPI000C9F1738|nr:hypothetical protein [Salinibacter altiplanensis]